jgi:hypothetical protein
MTINFPTAAHIFVSQIFGRASGMYTQYGLKGHNGVDFSTPVGTPIYACDDGVVTVAEERTGGYGRHVRIQHDTYLTIYGHLSSMKVKVGQEVVSGQEIGRSGGNTDNKYCGSSTGPHLHFEVRPNGVSSGNGYGGAVDPFAWLLAQYFQPAIYIAEVTEPWGISVRTIPSVLKPDNKYICGVVTKGTKTEIAELNTEKTMARVRSVRQEWLPMNFISLTTPSGAPVVIAGDVPVVPPPPVQKTVEQRLDAMEAAAREHGWSI